MSSYHYYDNTNTTELINSLGWNVSTAGRNGTRNFWNRPFTNATTATTLTSATTSPSGIAFAVVFVILLLFCYCIQPTIPTEEHRRGVELRQRARERFRRRRELKKPMTPEQRMIFIEKALITKRVMDCDAEGNLTLGDVPSEEDLEQQQLPPDDGRSFNSIEAEDESSTCVICLAAFRVGDVVAWSKANNDCLHVFHRDCITPWLQGPLHNDCPSCRSLILKFDSDDEAGELTTDDSEDDKTDEEGNDYDQLGGHSERSNQSASQIFVIMHGLISRARRASYSLIGQNIDTSLSFDDDEDDCDMEQGMPLPPSPGLRRVVSCGDRSTTLSLRRRASLRSSNDYHRLMQQQQPQQSSPQRKLVMPPLESLKTPLKLRRVVSADVERSRQRRLRVSASHVMGASSSEDDNSLPQALTAGAFMRTMRRRSASGTYTRLASTTTATTGSMDMSDHSISEEDIAILPVPSMEGPQRSVSWSNDLVVTSSSSQPHRRRSSSYQNSTFDEDEEDHQERYGDDEDVMLSEEDELELMRVHSLLAERSSRD